MGIEVHLDGLGERRVLGEEIYLDAFHRVEIGKLLRREGREFRWCCDGFYGRLVFQRRQVAAGGDFLFLGGDKWVELGNFHGVVPLLMFAEAKNVRHILWSRAVEEELVLAPDDFAQCVRLWGGQSRVRRYSQLPANLGGNVAIARIVGVDAILREARFGVAFFKE